MAGGVAALLSIFSELQAEHTDEEAVKIADRAISNLEEIPEMMARSGNRLRQSRGL